MTVDHAHKEFADRQQVRPELRRGRGALSNASGRFEKVGRFDVDDGWGQPEAESALVTRVFAEKAKRVITKNTSPDVPFDQSINPYRGCEHGCVYCFARPSHNYMGLSAGLDFETKLFAKENAAEILRAEISKPEYKMKPIALGSNTDPYQPIEKDLKITRSILEVLNEFNHPVTLLTKSRLIARDVDILAEMAKKGLVRAAISITTLDHKVARAMEPRASTPQRRLDAIRILSDAGIPMGVVFAPLIPGLNDHELEKVLHAAAHAGATSAAYILLRLPMELSVIFDEWLEEYFPDRRKKVMNRLKAMRGGLTNDPRFGHRMKGRGFEADLIRRRFVVHARKNKLNLDKMPLNGGAFARTLSALEQATVPANNNANLNGLGRRSQQQSAGDAAMRQLVKPAAKFDQRQLSLFG